MVNNKAEIEGHSIVLVGDFNTKIFQPAWFGREKLIQKSEENQAKIEIIHPEVVSFESNWLNIRVTRERFKVSTTQASFYESLRDLVLGTFLLLRHTPIRMMGINYDMHFRMDSVEQWHSFGNLLTPKELWDGILNKPGMRSLTMESVRPDGFKGYIRVSVEPSIKVEPGVYFFVNDHFEVGNSEKSIGIDEIIDILQNHWVTSTERSKSIIESLLEKA
ncbi:MAG: hypothetical protein IH874_01140 [Candidatus Dadabacteria bacterium]|nr:hypothetical protein [Candidatus Dadabacteria bacterium]